MKIANYFIIIYLVSSASSLVRSYLSPRCTVSIAAALRTRLAVTRENSRIPQVSMENIGRRTYTTAKKDVDGGGKGRRMIEREGDESGGEGDGVGAAGNFSKEGTRAFDANSFSTTRSAFLVTVTMLTLLVTISNIFPASALQQSAGGQSDALRLVDSANIFDPSNFQPVCPASDGVYQLLKYTANGLVGPDNVVEYGPLIASVLLRVRLELCVLESFVNEAVVPFVQQKGLSWILPLHETVETFLAGTIFAVASNFILLGSTKIVSVLLIYFDAITGFPARILGSGLKRTSSKEIGNVGTLFKLYGDLVGNTRKVVETVDTFVGRYLVIATTGYIAFKLVHFRLFNDLI